MIMKRKESFYLNTNKTQKNHKNSISILHFLVLHFWWAWSRFQFLNWLKHRYIFSVLWVMKYLWRLFFNTDGTIKLIDQIVWYSLYYPFIFLFIAINLTIKILCLVSSTFSSHSFWSGFILNFLAIFFACK